MTLEELIEIAPPWLLFGWVAPVVTVAILWAIVRALTVGRRYRSLEDGRTYCMNCRFDLHGGTTLSCPECGTTLGKYGLIVGGNRPPRSLTAKLFFTVLLITPPIAMTIAFALIAPPFNYTKTVIVQLEAIEQLEEEAMKIDLRGNQIYFGYSDVNTLAFFEIIADYGRLGGKPEHVTVRVWSSSYIFKEFELDENDAPREFFSERQFADLNSSLGLNLDSRNLLDSAREQLIATLVSLYADDGKYATEYLGPMVLDGHSSEEELNPHLAVLILLIAWGLWAWGYTLVIVTRWHRHSEEKYNALLQEAADTYRDWAAAGGSAKASAA